MTTPKPKKLNPKVHPARMAEHYARIAAQKLDANHGARKDLLKIADELEREWMAARHGPVTVPPDPDQPEAARITSDILAQVRFALMRAGVNPDDSIIESDAIETDAGGQRFVLTRTGGQDGRIVRVNLEG